MRPPKHLIRYYMTKPSESAIRKGEWGGPFEIFLEHMREHGAFEHGGIANTSNASPYWYGTILLFNKAEEILNNTNYSIAELEYLLQQTEQAKEPPIALLKIPLKTIIAKRKV